jgi:hypothetical protein
MTSIPAVCRAAVMLAVAVFTLAASAQVVLFDQPDLQGRKMTVRGDEPNLSDSDFNDKAQSLVVRGGQWELCVDSEFRGDCMRVQPGEYRNLDRRFVKSISSLRPVGGGNAVIYQGQSPPAQQPATVIVLPQTPEPSSCAVGATEACSACRISCTGGRQAVCKQGTEYPKLIGKPAECAFESQCSCR